MSTPYIEWAKLHQSAAYNLATSGVPHASFDHVGGSPTDMPLSGQNAYGYAPLLAQIADKHGVVPTQVVTTTGCSMANYLALATAISPGDEVLIERPTYEPLLAVAHHLGAAVVRFDRRVEDGCRVDPDAVRQRMTSRTRLVVIANLHNPTSQSVENAVLRAIGSAAETVGARVLVDEVYLDAIFDDTPSSCVHLGPTFVATNSLTKIYGLSSLRCGWILADEDFVNRAWRVADLYGNVQPFAPDWLATRAFAHLPGLRARARELLDVNRAMFEAWLADRDDVDVMLVQWGTTICLKPTRTDVFTLCRELRERYQVSVVPGHFFELPQYIRIGLTVDPTVFKEGLDRLGACLRSLSSLGRSPA
jgi:aspartate/methionine/tyrosine aminotransferase